MVNNLSSLASLTELNLRRNNIEYVTGLNQLPALQRVFLSHNAIAALEDIKCLFEVHYLIELSLDGNPLSEAGAGAGADSTSGGSSCIDGPARYRAQLVLGMPGLRHLDLKRVTEDERAAAAANYSFDPMQLLDPPYHHSSSNNNSNTSSHHSAGAGGGAGSFFGNGTAKYGDNYSQQQQQLRNSQDRASDNGMFISLIQSEFVFSAVIKKYHFRFYLYLIICTTTCRWNCGIVISGGSQRQHQQRRGGRGRRQQL